MSWENYEGAIEYLTGILDACVAYPKATIYIST